MRRSRARSQTGICGRALIFGWLSICLGWLISVGAPGRQANAEETPATTVQNISANPDVIAFSHDGARLASGTYSGQIQLWDVATGRLLRTIFGHTERIMAIAFSTDGKHVLLSSNGDIQSSDKMVKEWDVETGRLIGAATIKSDWRGFRPLRFHRAEILS